MGAVVQERLRVKELVRGAAVQFEMGCTIPLQLGQIRGVYPQGFVHFA